MPIAGQKSKNVAERSTRRGTGPVDQRAARSAEWIDAAFVALLHRRAYDGIRVGDIVRKAGVGRATFYAHYATKHALLASQLRRIVFPMLVATDGPCPLDARALFAHIGTTPAIYQGLMGGSSAPLVQQLFLACFEERVGQLASASPHRVACAPDVADGLAAHVMAATLLTLVGWHVRAQPRQTADAMQAIYARLIAGLQSSG